jgi:hypothetical protein
MIPKLKNQKGYAMLELLFYISFFAVLTIVVINAMISMTASFRESTVYTETLRSGNVMERMSREIRQADSISVIVGSTLGLNTTDVNGDPRTVQFSLSGGDVNFTEDGTLVGSLNPAGIQVSGLSFTDITTTEGRAVRIVLTVVAENDKHARSVEFYNTIGLRGSY